MIKELNENSDVKAAKDQPQQNDKAIIVNQLILRSIDRSMKEVEGWRNAHIAAERIIYPIRQRLYDYYSDVELDGHLVGIIGKRFKAVTNKKIYFKNSEGKMVDEFEPLLKNKKFRRLKKEILKTIMWGISGFEFIPGAKFDFAVVPRKHIKPEYKIIAKEQTGFDGTNYADLWNVYVIGESDDLGLLLNCCPYAIWKRGGFADFAQFVEIFGMPVRIYRYDAYDTKTKNEVTAVAENAGGAMSLIIPKQADFEMMDGKTANATGDLQDSFIRALNDEMSVIVLGNTQTTTSSEGSGYAQSKTHGQQQEQITQDDMEYLLQFLNDEKFLNILKSYGYPVAGGEFSFEQEIKVEELKARIEIDKAVAGMVPVDDDYFYNTYHIPKPDNYDELKRKMEEQKQQPAAPANNKPPKKKTQGPDEDIDDEVDDLAADDKNWWRKFRLTLADFFDPAPRD